jgi:hypothetical protein
MMQPYGRPQLVAKLPQSLKNATALRLWNQDFCLRNRSATGHWRRARQPREAAGRQQFRAGLALAQTTRNEPVGIVKRVGQSFTSRLGTVAGERRGHLFLWVMVILMSQGYTRIVGAVVILGDGCDDRELADCG